MISIENIKVNVANRGHITNSYIIYDDIEKEGILIDPGFEEDKIINKIKNLNINLKYIVITHAHGDHIGALKSIYEYTKCPIIVHENDYNMLLGKVENYSKIQGVALQDLSKCKIIKIKDGYSFYVKGLEFEVIHTPGHTSGGICIFEKLSKSLFTGDTLFCDCYGRCDLATANFNEMVDSIKKLFFRFSDITIYPGHGKSTNINSTKKYIKLLLKMKNITI